MDNRYYESTIAEEVYDKLFDNTEKMTVVWDMVFPDAEVNREFAYIKLNDEFVIKIERI